MKDNKRKLSYVILGGAIVLVFVLCICSLLFSLGGEDTELSSSTSSVSATLTPTVPIPTATIEPTSTINPPTVTPMVLPSPTSVPDSNIRPNCVFSLDEYHIWLVLYGDDESFVSLGCQIAMDSFDEENISYAFVEYTDVPNNATLFCKDDLLLYEYMVFGLGDDNIFAAALCLGLNEGNNDDGAS